VAPEVAVVGAGAWGTAIACHLADRAHAKPRVVLIARSRERADELRRDRRNARYLPDIALPARSRSTTTRARRARRDRLRRDADRARSRRSRAALADAGVRAPLAWLAKGFVRAASPDGGAALAHRRIAPRWPAPVGVVSGPSFAGEVARALPTALVAAATEASLAARAATLLRGDTLRVYESDDLTGVEVGGAVKNVLAIAAGLADGLGYGHNARAALITRGLAEISRLAVAEGGRRETLMGLAGLGDLVLTCTGDASRNRQVGLALAAGRPLGRDPRLARSRRRRRRCGARGTRARAQHGIEMPITEAVASVLDGAIRSATRSRRCCGANPGRKHGDPFFGIRQSRERPPPRETPACAARDGIPCPVRCVDGSYGDGDRDHRGRSQGVARRPDAGVFLRRRARAPVGRRAEDRAEREHDRFLLPGVLGRRNVSVSNYPVCGNFATFDAPGLYRLNFRLATWGAGVYGDYVLRRSVQVWVPESSQDGIAVEYYHAGLDHYFLTADEAEAAALDAGTITGWTRTGATFRVLAPPQAVPGVRPVCRYYGLPSAGLDTHFFSTDPVECAGIAQRWPEKWLLESASAFSVVGPRESGSCPGVERSCVFQRSLRRESPLRRGRCGPEEHGRERLDPRG
jgi:glycerol-3-phosphate dehydrogenase (NAD(P)+)